MLTDFEIFELIQDKEIIQKATNTILQSEASGKYFIENSEYKGQKLRYRAKNTGTYNIDYLATYEFNIGSLSFKKRIEFYKPIGFYYFDETMKLSFWILNKYRSISANQDNYAGLKKNINIYRSKDDPLIDPIIEGFSTENKFILTNLDNFIQQGKQASISKADSLFLTSEFIIYPTIDKITFRYLTSYKNSLIQVYVKNIPNINFPILEFNSDKKMIVNPMIKKYYDKHTELDILSSNWEMPTGM